MVKKIAKKLVCATLALGSVFGSTFMFSGCTTDRPEAEIKLQFNGKTYTLEYTMYRKIAPATVKHFIKLAENKYYNNTIVHDYADKKMYMGGYEYKSDDKSGTMELDYAKDYFGTVSTYSKFPVSVWADSARKTPTYTLYGEFANNKFNVENGRIAQSYGSLTMFYVDKEEAEQSVVTTKRNDGKGYDHTKTYEYNSATSLFYISLSTTETTPSSYCTFAKLDSDSKSTLKKLESAIADYIEKNLGKEEDAADDFTETISVYLDEEDPILGNIDQLVTYDVPVEPIIVKSVKITKY